MLRIQHRLCSVQAAINNVNQQSQFNKQKDIRKQTNHSLLCKY